MSALEYTALQEQIKGLTTLVNAHFQNVHERLDKINGSVGEHEQKIQEALIERAQNREEQRHHITTLCECKYKLEKIEKNMEDLGFSIRHPKLFVAILVTIVILTLGTFIDNNPFKVFTPQLPQTEQTK
jgi:hypothetical protein